MSFKQITIKANNRSIDIRNELISYGLENDFKEKIFINKFDLEPLIFEQLVWLCDKHYLEYEIIDAEIEKEENDYSKYILAEVDNFNYLIKLNDSKFTCYFINFYFTDNWVEIHILDIRKGLYLKDKIPHFKSKDKLFEVLEYYSYHHERLIELNFEESDFFIVANPLIKTNKILYNEKENIRKFKFDTIRKIKEKGTNSFLCNCVPGFYPEIEFTLMGNKIESSATKNNLSEQQEYKIWKYLYNNRQYVAQRKEPTLYDLFINRKILVNIEGMEVRALIVKVMYEDYSNSKTSKLIVTISDGNKIHKLAKAISKDDLFKMVVDAR